MGNHMCQGSSSCCHKNGDNPHACCNHGSDSGERSTKDVMMMHMSETQMTEVRLVKAVGADATSAHGRRMPHVPHAFFDWL